MTEIEIRDDTQTTVTEIDPQHIAIIEDTTSTVIEIIAEGPPGIPGTGGGGGGGDKFYMHIQDSAALTWTIVHNLNKYPSVMVVDTGGSVVVGDIDYLSVNTLIITFTASFSGRAYMN